MRLEALQHHIPAAAIVLLASFQAGTAPSQQNANTQALVLGIIALIIIIIAGAIAMRRASRQPKQAKR